MEVVILEVVVVVEGVVVMEVMLVVVEEKEICWAYIPMLHTTVKPVLNGH